MAEPVAATEQCQTVKKYKGAEAIEVVLCRDADGVYKERAKTFGDSQSAFRGKVSYNDEFAGTWQRVMQPPRQQLNLNTLLRDSLARGAPSNAASGDIGLSVEFSGKTVSAILFSKSAWRLNFKLTGIVENGRCQMSDPSSAVTLTGRCTAEGFDGVVASNPPYGTRFNFKIAARATAVTDFDERDLQQAGERAELERRRAEEKTAEERFVADQVLLAQSGDVAAMFLLGQIFAGKEKTNFIPYNIGEAVKWYGRAANLGHAPSMYRLGFIHYDGTAGQTDETKALELFTRCAAVPSDAQAYCHEVAGGLQIRKDTPTGRAKGMAHWRACARMGLQSCADRLARVGQ